jgi:hypothetical protein
VATKGKAKTTKYVHGDTADAEDSSDEAADTADSLRQKRLMWAQKKALARDAVSTTGQAIKEARKAKITASALVDVLKKEPQETVGGVDGPLAQAQWKLGVANAKLKAQVSTLNAMATRTTEGLTSDVCAGVYCICCLFVYMWCFLTWPACLPVLRRSKWRRTRRKCWLR